LLVFILVRQSSPLGIQPSLEYLQIIALLNKTECIILFLLVFVSVAKDLIHEAQMYKLHHPNIVMLIAVIFESSHYGVVFEYVTYGGLESLLEDYEVRFACCCSSGSLEPVIDYYLVLVFISL